MAKKEYYDEEINKYTDWGGDESTGFLQVSGSRVQEFIKKTMNAKAGVFHYDTTNNRYLVFADEDTRDEYLENPTRTDLLIGNFDAPFNYQASINLISDPYVSILTGTTGNEIKFTFDVVNKQGADVGDNVICTYTFVRGTTKKQVSARYQHGQTVVMNIDKYLMDGTNQIIIGIVGENTLAATTISVTYQVVNLKISSDLDISRVYDLSTTPNSTAEVGFTVSGQGIKVVEWILDGEVLEKDPYVDEITQGEATRTKYIELSNLNQGVHTLQIRAYTVINEERFYSQTLYYELIVYTGSNLNPIVVMSTVLPVNTVIDERNLFNGTQYDDFSISLASYDPSGGSVIPVDVTYGGQKQTTLETTRGSVYSYSFFLPESGEFNLEFGVNGNTVSSKSLNISPSSINLQEINNGLEFYLSGSNKNNSSSDRDSWVYGDYEATFKGFDWSEFNGWNNGSLVIPEGSSVSINYAPLSLNSVDTGKTIEIEIGSKNVTNDDALILNLTNKSGVGIKITASEAILTSSGGSKVSTKYKSEQLYRISFVINKKSGVSNKGLAFIYVNGVHCGAINYSVTDNFLSDTTLSLKGTSEATVVFKSIRVYNVALSGSDIINNYAFYQTSSYDRVSIVNNNDILDDNTGGLSWEKLSNQLPVMIITGDIPFLEATTDKKTSIVAQVQYINNQDSSLSFTATNMKITPQGTSSMGYPKKNYKLYTQERDDTKIYDSNGKEIKDRLYSFKKGSIPVNCWCLKADYAESSSTHNTGVARLWGDILKNAKVNGEYVLRTEAQRIAAESGYPYDVRTSIDGFPIVVFYRLDEESDLVFLGKYNFNNDKSTENVFGFRDIPGFDNSRMQCWEVLNNGHHLALFNDVDNFDSDWSDAFESRYPDTSTPDTTDLKAFATWMSEVTSDDFIAQKWDHLDIYKVAAYYVYLMRFGAVDQVVKNAMFTSEDGQHFYFILYDNDSINGLRNDGPLVFPPDITRQTLDDTYTSEVYCYAGHDSRLWNMLEDDEEFMQIVREIDNALYSAGLSYKNTIDMFDNKQSSQWCQRVYNEDAQYKYIQPYTQSGINNLFMLQGDRRAHRQWWLSKRFAKYDSEWVTGEYKSSCIECKLASAPVGLEFGISAGYPFLYGYGINNVPQETGVDLDINGYYRFSTNQVLNIGDPLRIYGAYYIKSVSMVDFAPYLTVLNIGGVYSDTLGTKLEELCLNDDTAIDTTENTSLTTISGLSNAINLKKLYICGFKSITNLDFSTLSNLEHLSAYYSGLTSAVFPNGRKLKSIGLTGAPVKSILINNSPITIESIVVDWENVDSIQFGNSVNLGLSMDYIYDNWFRNKTLEEAGNCILKVDKVSWSTSVYKLLKLKKNLSELELKGKITLTGEVTEENLLEIMSLFGENVFNPDSELFISIPDQTFLLGPTEVTEGGQYQYTGLFFNDVESNIVYSISSGEREGTSIDSKTGILTVEKNEAGNVDVVIRATQEGKSSYVEKTISILNCTYPTSIDIWGPSKIIDTRDTYNYRFSEREIDWTGEYSVSISISESLSPYVEMEGLSNYGFTLNVIGTKPDHPISGTIDTTVTKVYNQEVSATGSKTFWVLPEGIVMTSETNPEVLSILHSAGLTSDESFMTISDAEAVTETDLNPDESIINNAIFCGYDYSTKVYKNQINSFDEFIAFTGITRVPKDLLNYQRTLTYIPLPDTIEVIGKTAFANTSIAYIDFPNSLKELEELCLSNTKFKHLDFLPDSLEIINYYVFVNNFKLESVIIPESVKSLGKYLFDGCRELSSFTLLSKNITVAPEGLFLHCSKISDINVLPNWITQYGDICFGYCESLTDVVIPDNIQIINNRCFANCSGIESVIIPDSVVEIKPDANFAFCTNLRSVVLSKNLKYISGDCFWGCAFTSIDLPEGLLSINDWAFEECRNLQSIVIPNSVTEIRQYAFLECNSLRSVVIGDSVTTLGEGAFMNCSSLESIYIPSSVRSIGNQCFVGCTNLKTIIFGNNQSGIEFGLDVFKELTGITKVSIFNSESWCRNTFGNEYSNPIYYSHNLYQSESGEYLNTISVPEDITEIPDYLFINWLNDGSTRQYVNIPNSVRSIGTKAFYNCGGDIEITIGGSVETIGNSAFCNCAGASIINNSTSLVSIGEHSFYNCQSLETLDLPETLKTIGGSAFENCSQLQHMTIPSQVTSLGSTGGCFAGCFNLVSVKILSNSITALEPGTFAGCSSLREINIPNSVTSIYDMAFMGCSSLEIIEIPSSVNRIHSDVFSDCTSLNKVIISNIESWCNTNVLYKSSNPLYYAHHLYLGDTEITDLVIPDTITKLNDNIFRGYTGNSVTIPESITSLGDESLGYCNIGTLYFNTNNCTTISTSWCTNSTIGSIVFGDNLTSIPNLNLSRIQGLTSVTIGNSITEIDNNAFYTCSSLTSVTIPNSVTSIGNYAFTGCTGLTSVVIPDSVVSIGEAAFFDCGNLSSVTLGTSLTTIGTAAFNSTHLTSISIPKSVTSIGEAAFSGLWLTSIVYNAANCTMGENWFDGTNPITSLTIGEDVEVIPEGLCTGLSKLTSVTFNARNCNSVPSGWLSSATNINSFVIGENVEVIPAYLCYKLTSLTSITIGESVTSIGYASFGECSGLTKVIINDISAWCNINFEISSSNPLQYAHHLYLGDNEITSITIPNSVTKINSYIFCKCTGLTSVTIPNSVTEIGDSAFWGCSGLTSVTIGNSVTSIGSDAFTGCSGLTSVTIPNSVTYIGSSAFYKCTGLTSVTIPNSVTSSIGDMTFYYCTGLTSVTIGNSVTSIGSDAFTGCTGLTSVTIGNSVTSIGTQAFASCSDLTSVTIPNSVTSIKERAFSGCSSLNRIEIDRSTAPTISSSTFGDNNVSYTGRNTYDQKRNILWVPSDSTGYDTGYWASVLLDSTKCGFTISYT